jgi:hypothetical protein
VCVWGGGFGGINVTVDIVVTGCESVNWTHQAHDVAQ